MLFNRNAYICGKNLHILRMKTENILPFHWRTEIEDFERFSIDDDIILVENLCITSFSQYPFRMDVTLGFVCVKGTTEGSINLKPYNAKGPCLVTILPGHIIEYQSTSEDFSGSLIILSSKFINNLMENAAEHLPLFLSVRENPVIPLNEETLKGIIMYFELLKRLALETDHPYRLEVARYLTLAFFYGANIDFHKITFNRKMTHQEMLVEKFLNLARTHHKQQRELNYYAKKLIITPKYLSKVVKETSGRPANDWIDDLVVLEAKALLKSTNMTIQQISDELNFPSQSFFGKYFKRVTGMSPSEYKRKM